jgi:hypothetical protein
MEEIENIRTDLYKIFNQTKEILKMKKMLLVGMLVVSGLSFGRDFEYRERQELQVVQETFQMDMEMLSRERGLFEQNIDVYPDFHRELNNMSRGSENK